ncbi:MAG: sulfatase [Planctomycetaceae bacterium]|nr:sulfatase [Planctomycetaceae bacterium]
MITLRCSALLLAAFAVFNSVNADDRPNIIFIFSDDHASHAMSCYGSKINTTPNLDRIANEGMLFTNCFCTNSICGPSRAVIQTGKHSHLNGFLRNGNRFNGDQQTFPKLLQKVGYQTAVVGKWHLETAPQGFDYSEILIGQGPYYNPPMLLNGDPKPVKHTGYTTDIITDLALDWLKEKRDADKPFMLMFQHKAPHRNWQPGPKHLHLYENVEIPEPDNLFDDWSGRGTAAQTQDMSIRETLTRSDLKLDPPRGLTPEQLKAWNEAYEPRNKAFVEAKLQGDDLVRWKYQRYIKDYLRCVASVDDNVGRVLDYLDQTGLAENTVVIYSSDQGFYLGDHGWFDKRFMYEESYRMPLIVRWPGKIQPHTVNHNLVSNLDFAETFLDIAGTAIPSDMQGLSLKNLMTASPQENAVPAPPMTIGYDRSRKDCTQPDFRDALYYHYYEFEANQQTAHMVRRHCGVRTATDKLIHFYNLGEWEYYDLNADPREMRSRFDDPEFKDRIQVLQNRLKELQTQYQVPDDSGSVPANPPSLQKKANPPRQQRQKKDAA